ncbi:MAG: hypothetical protein JW760_00590 [Spirochaetales bacterium]|nr:hypothetical protein [Spirochaetales bacterium]
MSKDVHVISPNIDRNKAAGLLSAYSGSFLPQVQRLIYYPYLWIHYLYSVKTFLGHRSIRAYILVDLVHNIASTADAFEHTLLSTEEESLIRAKTSVEDARKTAETYLLHSAIHKMKTLLLPSAVVQEEQVIYKPFWIVRCSDRRRRTFHILVDGITGKHEILNLQGDDL